MCYVVFEFLLRKEENDNWTPNKMVHLYMTSIASTNDIRLGSVSWHIPLVLRGDETAAANERSNGFGAFARVICPRQGGDVRLIDV